MTPADVKKAMARFRRKQERDDIRAENKILLKGQLVEALETTEDENDDADYPIYINPISGARDRQLADLGKELRLWKRVGAEGKVTRLRQPACPRNPGLPRCNALLPRTNKVVCKDGSERKSICTSRFSLSKRKEHRASSRPMNAETKQAPASAWDPDRRPLKLSSDPPPRGKDSRLSWTKFGLSMTPELFNWRYPSKRQLALINIEIY
jgi:hypothetical protein